MGPRIRIAVRVLGVALLIFAGVRFVIAVASSFRSEDPMSHADDGFQIHHIIHIDFLMLLAGFLGTVAVVASIAVRRAKVQRGQI